MPPEGQHDLQAAFAAYLRDPMNCPAPEGIEERRLAIYRRLFFGNLSNLMAKNFPVLRRMLDDTEWDRLIRELMVDHRSQTPLFPEIGSEMVRFVAEAGHQWLEKRPWMAELVHWEYLETVARLHEAEVKMPPNAPENLLNCRIFLNPTLQIARYTWPVHQIGPDFVPCEPLDQPINLLVYRRSDDQVAFERVNDLSLRLLQLAQNCAVNSVRELLHALANEAEIEPPDPIIEGGQAIVRHLIEREIAGCRHQS
jgi:hypothetical protein